MDWKQEMLWLTVTYRMLECGDSIPLDTAGTGYAFVEDDLRAMHNKGIIDIGEGNEFWRPTEKAQELRKKMLAMYDQALKFEVFGTVNLAIELDDDNSDDGDTIYDDLYDPRFAEPETPEQAEEWGTEDMRLAVIQWLSRTLADSDKGREQGITPVDPHRIVYFQFLADGRFKDENVWFDLKLGQPFAEIDEIVESAYTYTDVSDDPGEIDSIMSDVYAAGMIEERKRGGRECPGCGIPLAAFELHTREDEGEPLVLCPNPECGHDLTPPPPEDEWQCPSCQTPCNRSQQFCFECGARLDWTLPAGTVHTESEVTHEWDDDSGEYVWGGYYGYQPYGWYDPYDPYYDMVAFGALCWVLW